MSAFCLSLCISLHGISSWTYFQLFLTLSILLLNSYIWGKTLMELLISLSPPTGHTLNFPSLSFHCPRLLTYTTKHSFQFLSSQPWPILHISPNSLSGHFPSSWHTEKSIPLFPTRYLLVPLSLIHAEGGPQQPSNNCVPSCLLKMTSIRVFFVNKSDFLVIENLEKATIQK